MVHVVIDRYFSLFLKGLKIFLNPRLSLIVPLSLMRQQIKKEEEEKKAFSSHSEHFGGYTLQTFPKKNITSCNLFQMSKPSNQVIRVTRMTHSGQ